MCSRWCRSLTRLVHAPPPRSLARRPVRRPRRSRRRPRPSDGRPLAGRSERPSPPQSRLDFPPDGLQRRWTKTRCLPRHRAWWGPRSTPRPMWAQTGAFWGPSPKAPRMCRPPEGTACRLHRHRSGRRKGSRGLPRCKPRPPTWATCGRPGAAAAKRQTSWPASGRRPGPAATSGRRRPRFPPHPTKSSAQPFWSSTRCRTPGATRRGTGCERRPRRRRRRLAVPWQHPLDAVGRAGPPGGGKRKHARSWGGGA
mmetsp:Transcript_40065/g.101788  ORF Transcript_40065/g.101788 Transcript_40065/m.101788 type:complete len:254 (+) Transcript_40065:288-1049(+)